MTLEELNVSDVGELSDGTRFVVYAKGDGPWVSIRFADGSRTGRGKNTPVKFLGRKYKIVPARIEVENDRS